MTIEVLEPISQNELEWHGYIGQTGVAYRMKGRQWPIFKSIDAVGRYIEALFSGRGQPTAAQIAEAAKRIAEGACSADTLHRNLAALKQSLARKP